MVKIINPEVDVLSEDERLIIKKTQWIDPKLTERLKQERIATQSGGFGELAKLASIPTIFVEKWLREGFVLWQATPDEITRKLHKDGLEGFLATDKRL